MAAVLIKDEKLEEFLLEARAKGWLLEEEAGDGLPSDYVIPQWQMDEVQRRQETTKPEEYIAWSELKKKYDRREL